MRKPFDVLSEVLLSKTSRGDWTPLELFVAGVRTMQTLEPLTCKEVISFSARRSSVD
jgi:hypothetical protein